MVLQIPIATEYFYNFLDRQQASTVSNSSRGSLTSDSTVTYLFSLYVDLRQFDKAVLKDVEEEMLL
jgi:hypothetical protein